MKKENISSMIEKLPFYLKERIDGYVKSVDIVLIDIFKSAGVKYSDEIAQDVIFIAFLKKFYAIVNSAYWTLDNTGEILENNGISSVWIGSTNYSRYSEYYGNLFRMQDKFKTILEDGNVFEMVFNMNYKEIIKHLSNEY